MLQMASRGVILAVVLTVVYIFVSIKSKRWIKIIVITLAVLFVLFLYSNQYTDFILARFNQDNGTGNNRTLIWFSKINEFFSNGNLFDWIFGIGQRNGIRIGITVGDAFNGMSTHNDFLSVLIYYGFVGVVLFFYAISYPLRICQKADRPQILAMLLYLLMCSMTLEPLARGNFVYWGFLFYIFVLARQSQAKRLKAKRRILLSKVRWIPS
jgi:O-antigen ligase